jgi:hypothetical protein
MRIDGNRECFSWGLGGLGLRPTDSMEVKGNPVFVPKIGGLMGRLCGGVTAPEKQKGQPGSGCPFCLMFGAPGEIRTPYPLVRSQVLYPDELRAHSLVQSRQPHLDKNFGSSTWARTRDLRINSPALYRLSYRGSVKARILMASSGGVNRIQAKFAISPIGRV